MCQPALCRFLTFEQWKKVSLNKVNRPLVASIRQEVHESFLDQPLFVQRVHINPLV